MNNAIGVPATLYVFGFRVHNLRSYCVGLVHRLYEAGLVRSNIWSGRLNHVMYNSTAISLIFCLAAGSHSLADDAKLHRAGGNTVSFVAVEGKLRITIGGRPFATYVYQDEKIPRPYFAHVFTPVGIQVTRNHPPIEGKDRTDHATFHPGIWQAFGDISGADFWRNRATVRHVRFVQQPKGGRGQGSFVVQNRYESNGKPICDETCRFTISVRPSGILLIWDSTFRSDQDDFYFGDQEEMGLGVRVATPISVVKGGQIINSDGLKNERQAWGKQANWCDYSGNIDGYRVGITLMPDPKNFRRSWFHARDYGLLLANAFGRNAFTKGKKSRVVVKKGETFRLRTGVLVHGSKANLALNLPNAYRDFLKQIQVSR